MSKRAASILLLTLSVLPWACSTTRPVRPLELAEDIVIAPDDVVTRPEVIHRQAPAYPQELRDEHVQGGRPWGWQRKIVAKGVVTRQGLLEHVQILIADEPPFTKSVLDALALWRFKPATINGEPVAAYFTVTVTLRAE